MDFRERFSKRCSRKPVVWEEINSAPVTDGEKDLFKELPVVQVHPRVKITQVILSRGEKVREVIMLRANDAYYVNTEGYQYPRYIFKIENMTAQDFNS